MARVGPQVPIVALAACLAACAGQSALLDGDGAPVSPGGGAPAGGQTGRAIFVDRARELGLTFTHYNGMSGERYFVEMIGAGGALFDMDGDGDLDAFLPQGQPLGPAGATPDPPGGRLFRNDLQAQPRGAPEPRFVDVTPSSGLNTRGYGMAVATGDYDQDGDVDLYVANWGPNELWRNDGGGRFSEVGAAAGVADSRWSTGASFLDYDRDGWLDLVVVNYNRYRLEDDRACHSAALGMRDYCGPHSYPLEPGSLYRNRGDGTFEDVSVATGFASAYGPAMGVAGADLTGDGWPDILVANDGQPNLLWVNQAGQGFREEGMQRGVAVNRQGTTEANMGIVLQDMDGDCDADLLITHLDNEMNTLWVNDGQGYFQDRTPASGLGPLSLPFTGFGVADIDADNDGIQDLYVANGEVNVIAEQVTAGDPLPLRQTDLFFRGLGGGRYEDWRAEGGAHLSQPAVGRGLSMGDVDNDGDSDLLETFNDGPARLLINQVGQDHAWIGLRLTDGGGRRDLQGATVTLAAEGQPPRCRRSQTDGSYASAQDPRLLFGLGTAPPAALSAEVAWPDGERETFPSLQPGRYHLLRQGEGQP